VHHIQRGRPQYIRDQQRSIRSHHSDLRDSADDTRSPGCNFARHLEKDQSVIVGGGAKNVGDQNPREPNMLEHIAADDQVSTYCSGIGSRSHARSGWGSRDIEHEWLGTFYQSEDEVAVIASMIENPFDLSLTQVLFQDWRKPCSSFRVIRLRSEISIEGPCVPRLR